MHLKKRQKHYNTLLVLMLLFNILAQAAIPAVAYASEIEDTPTLTAAEVDTPISVSDLITQNNPGGDLTVEGYIVGYVVSKTNVSRDRLDADTNFAIADTIDEIDPAKMAFVQIPSGNLRSEFGLQTNPNNIGRKVIVTAKAEAYFNHFGLKSASAMTFTDSEEDSDGNDTPGDGEDEPAPDPLELKSINEVRVKNTGEVKTKGIVTAKLKNSIQIQDETGGIAVRPTSLDVELGEKITVEGSLKTYNELLQIDPATLIEKEESTIPTPLPIKGNELGNHESEFIILKNIKIVGEVRGNSWVNYNAEDSDGTKFIIRDDNGDLSLAIGEEYTSITGIASTFNADKQIIPRSNADIVPAGIQPAYATPAAGLVPIGTEVNLNTISENAEIYYTLNGSEPTKESSLYEEPIVVDEATTIRAITFDAAGNSADIREFAYTVYDNSKGTKIHHIQGESHESEFVGATVNNVVGVVTYIYDINGAHYFHMQTPDGKDDDNPKTSEGIVVYTNNKLDLEVGNLVSVTGTVDEYHIDGYAEKAETDLSITQINARNGAVVVKEDNVKLPTAIKITSSDIPSKISGQNTFTEFEPEKYAIDFWESIEGMRVEIAPSTAAAPQQHGDLVVVTDDFEPSALTVNGGILLGIDGPNAQSIQFKVQPNGQARDLRVKTGDKFTKSLTGVVNYGFGNYKVYADLTDVVDALEEGIVKPKGTTIVKNPSKLTVATYNVENFSANTSYTSNEKAKRIAESFVDDMNSPDIIGIVEVMANRATNSSSPEANESFERLIDEIAKADGPTYKYANIDPEMNQDGGAPGGNIRVGYLYNPERVTFVEADKGGATEAVAYENGQLTLNPGRVEPSKFPGTRKPLAAQFEFNGESVVIVNNHLNSKNGDEPEYGQNLGRKGSEAERHGLATVVNNFVKEILVDNPNENVIVLGDMNDFQFSKTLEILEGNELTNLVNKVPTAERYNYVYQGNSQVLDHILVSKNLAETAEIDMIHINSDFTNMHGRASDHDPVLAQLDLSVTNESDTFELPIMHMNDTHSNVENYAYMMNTINGFREDNPGSLLLHAGDVFSGTLYFNLYEGRADLALMNLMGIDAMVFGNHEFDLGNSADGHKALADFVKGADFPFLGTNIDFSKDVHMKDLDTNNSVVSEPSAGKIYNSIVLDVDGEKVGVFGLTTEDTKNIASPVDITFTDYVKAAEDAVAEFEAEGINKIVALTHIGYNTAPDVGNDLLLAEKVKGIDVIVGGHSHTTLDAPVVVNDDQVDPTVIVQTGSAAENLGTLNVQFSDEGHVVGYAGQLLDVEQYQQDPEALEILEPYAKRIEEFGNEEIGAEAMKDLVNPRHGDGEETSVRANETELGNLVTDAMLYKAREKYPETVIAVQNGGGIRAPISKGQITVADVINVLPFGNDPVVAELTGQEIKDLLEFSVRQAPAENGGFLHVSGMKFFYDSEREVNDRVVAMYVVNGDDLVEIDLTEDYLVTTNGYTGQGGDGFDTFAKAFAEGRVRDIGEIDWEQLRDYMVEEEYLNGVVDPVIEGRIIDLKGEGLPTDPTDPEDSIELEVKLPGKKVTITITGEGLEGLELVAKDAVKDVKNIPSILGELYDLFNISLVDAYGNKVQPNGPVTVRIEFEAGRSPKKVFHFGENFEIAEELDFKVVDGAVVFTTDSFSYFGIQYAEATSGETPGDTDEPGTPTTPGDGSTPGETGQPGSPTTPGKTPGATESADKDKDLPATGSSIIVPLIGGMSLILAGLGTELYRKKRYKN